MPILFCLWVIWGSANTSLRTLIVFTVIRLRKANLFDGPPTPLFCWAVRTHVSNKLIGSEHSRLWWNDRTLQSSTWGLWKHWKHCKENTHQYFFGNTGLRLWRGGEGGNHPKYLRPGRFILMDFRLSTWVASFKSQQQDQLATSLLNRSVSVRKLVRGEQECHFGVRIWNG